jgi:hypothetical protein
MATETPGRGAAGGLRVENSFHVGPHLVKTVRESEGRWSVVVDGTALDGTHRTQADAWEAGVREADKRDRSAT